MTYTQDTAAYLNGFLVKVVKNGTSIITRESFFIPTGGMQSIWFEIEYAITPFSINGNSVNEPIWNIIEIRNLYYDIPYASFEIDWGRYSSTQSKVYMRTYLANSSRNTLQNTLQTYNDIWFVKVRFSVKADNGFVRSFCHVIVSDDPYMQNIIYEFTEEYYNTSLSWNSTTRFRFITKEYHSAMDAGQKSSGLVGPFNLKFQADASVDAYSTTPIDKNIAFNFGGPAYVPSAEQYIITKQYYYSESRYSGNQLFAMDYKFELADLQGKINALVATKNSYPAEITDRSNVSTGPTHDYSDFINTLFTSQFTAITSALTKTFTKSERNENTGDKLQDAINIVQNNVDNGLEDINKMGVWIIQQLANMGSPFINVLFKGIYDNIASFGDKIIGFVFNNVLPGIGSEVKHFGDLLKNVLSELYGDFIDFTDSGIEYEDFTEYWNLMVSALDFDNDSTVAIYLIGPSIGISALPPNTLIFPKKVHFNILDVDVEMIDLIYFIWWMKHLPILHIDILGEGIPIPLGMLYWVLKDILFPFSDTISAMGLQPSPAFHSGRTDGWTFKDATCLWFVVGMLQKLFEHLGLDKKYIIMITNKIAQRFKVNLKDITGRLKGTENSDKLTEAETTINTLVKANNDLIDASKDIVEQNKRLMNYVVGWTAQLTQYLLDPLHNKKPLSLSSEDLYDGVYNPE